VKNPEHRDPADANPRRDHFKPGQAAPYSGQYELIGPCERTDEERTVVLGEPLVPNPQPETLYVLSDPSKNGAGEALPREP